MRIATALLSATLFASVSGCWNDSGVNPVPDPAAAPAGGGAAGGAAGGAGGGAGGGTAGGTGGTGGSGGGAPSPSSIVPTWYGVQANILQQFCTVCHSGAAAPKGLSWEVGQYDAIVTNGHMSTEVTTMREVQPGNPDASYMVWKITGNPGISGVRMPATGIPLGVPSDATAGGSGGPPPPVVGSWMYVWTEALQICTLCHSNTPSSSRCGVDFGCPPKGVVLTADNYNGVVDGNEVRPFDLNGSNMWRRVTDPDPSKRMPFGLPPLTQAQLDIIRAWITDGAPLCPAGQVCP